MMTKINNTQRSIIAIVSIIIFLIIGIRSCESIFLARAIRINKEIAELDSVTYSKKAPEEYLDLFANRADLVCDQSVISKHRNPITEFHNEQFYIEIYKLDISPDLGVDQILKESFNTSEQSLSLYYNNYSSNKFLSVAYRLGAKGQLSGLYFELFGLNTHVLKKNDSVGYYFSNFDNFSLKYQKDGQIDIYGKAKTNNKILNVPIEILFLKRNSNLYFICLTNINYSEKLNSLVLYNLFMKK